mmetsp:Transcript_3689/g.9448  ORF Transcript_3689/g.9448 Transcript_3689/m.9448 type:complete len:245 (+) Transcript_3689:553-1287(+)
MSRPPLGTPGSDRQHPSRRGMWKRLHPPTSPTLPFRRARGARERGGRDASVCFNLSVRSSPHDHRRRGKREGRARVWGGRVLWTPAAAPGMLSAEGDGPSLIGVDVPPGRRRLLRASVPVVETLQDRPRLCGKLSRFSAEARLGRRAEHLIALLLVDASRDLLQAPQPKQRVPVQPFEDVPRRRAEYLAQARLLCDLREKRRLRLARLLGSSAHPSQPARHFVQQHASFAVRFVESDVLQGKAA